MKINIHEKGSVISYDDYSIKFNGSFVHLVIYNNNRDIKIIKLITYPCNKIEKIFENRFKGVTDVYIID